MKKRFLALLAAALFFALPAAATSPAVPPSEMGGSAEYVAFTPDDAEDWGTPPISVDAALEDIVATPALLVAAKYGMIADAVVATGGTRCTDYANPKVCDTDGTGTDSSSAWATLMDRVATLGNGGAHIRFTNTGTGLYRGYFLVDEHNVEVSCEPGVKLMPRIEDTNGGRVMRVLRGAAYARGFKAHDCYWYDDNPEARGHAWYDIAELTGAPTGGATGSITALADYGAPVLTTGSGLDDIIRTGTFTGHALHTYVVTVSDVACTDLYDDPACPSTPQTSGSPDGACDSDCRVCVGSCAADEFTSTFNDYAWRDLGVARAMTTSPQELSHGISVDWNAASGHTDTDAWTIKATIDPEILVTASAAHKLTGDEAVQLYSMSDPIHDMVHHVIRSPDATHFTVLDTYVSTETGSFRQVPRPGESVTFDGGGAGKLARHDENEDEVRVYTSTGALTTDDVVTYDCTDLYDEAACPQTTGSPDNFCDSDAENCRGKWSVTIVASPAPVTNTADNMRGLELDRAEDPVVENNIFHSFGGSALVVTSSDTTMPTTGAKVTKNKCYNAPSLVAKEGCLEVRVSAGGYYSGNEMEGGVSAGFASNPILALSCAPGSSGCSSDNVFSGNLIYDRSEKRVDRADTGVHFQANQAGVDIANTTFSAGGVDLNHKYNPYGNSQGSFIIGTNIGRILNLISSGQILLGQVDLNGHLENTIEFSHFKLEGYYGRGMLAKGAVVKLSDGEILGFGDGAFSAGASSGDVTLHHVDVSDSGAGWSGGSISTVSAAANQTGFFHLDHVNVWGVPPVSGNQTLVECNGLLESKLTQVEVYDSKYRGIVGCRELFDPRVENTGNIGVYIDSTPFGYITNPRIKNTGTSRCLYAAASSYTQVRGGRYEGCGGDAVEINNNSDGVIVSGGISMALGGGPTGEAFTCGTGTDNDCSDNVVLTP